MRKMEERVGEVFTSNEGCKFVIVEYENAKKVWIKFLDEHGARIRTSYKQCLNGQISNPYFKSVCGVACVGLMSDGTRPKVKVRSERNTREYDVWRAMINRCYSDKYHEKNPTYKNVTVCNRWLVYANFLEDLPKIEGYELWLKSDIGDRVALDKDLKQQDVEDKVYSLETVMFISITENCRERNERCGNPTQSVKVQGENIKTSEKTKVFESIHEASRELGIKQCSISSCLNGKYGFKTVGGYKWFKVE